MTRTYGDRSVTYGDLHVNYDGAPVALYFLPADNGPLRLNASSKPQASTKRASSVPSLASGATMVTMISRGGSYRPGYSMAASYIPTENEGAAE